MREIVFKVWYLPEKKLYYRGYQKISHVLLCEDDRGAHGGKGIPVKKVSYDDCEFLETTSLADKNGTEIFEGDKIRVRTKRGICEGIVDAVPDMFRSRNIHPLQTIFDEYGIQADEVLELEVIGNRYDAK